MSVRRRRLVFRVYPEPWSRLHVVVRVFPTLAALRAYARRFHYVTLDLTDALAICQTYDRRQTRTRRLLPDLGEILLAHGYLSVRIISHEVLHATFAWMARRRLEAHRVAGLVSPDEERVCHAHARMVAAICARIARINR